MIKNTQEKSRFFFCPHRRAGSLSAVPVLFGASSWQPLKALPAPSAFAIPSVWRWQIDWSAMRFSSSNSLSLSLFACFARELPNFDIFLHCKERYSSPVSPKVTSAFLTIHPSMRLAEQIRILLRCRSFTELWSQCGRARISCFRFSNGVSYRVLRTVVRVLESSSRKMKCVRSKQYFD